MDKTAEIAAWKENHVPIDRNGDDALVMHKMADGSREFIVAHGYDEETGHWGHGTYYDSLASAAADLEAAPSPAPVRRSSARLPGTAPTSNPPLRTPVSK